MKKFSIKLLSDYVLYNHYLSYEFIKKEGFYDYFKGDYSLLYPSRKFDKPAQRTRDGTCVWWLDFNWHRVGKPAIIWSNGSVLYYENGKRVKCRGLVFGKD